MKIKAMKHLIVGNGNTKVMNKKESLLTKDFIINFKELSDQQVMYKAFIINLVRIFSKVKLRFSAGFYS